MATTEAATPSPLDISQDTFKWPDYLLFAISFAITLIVGLVVAIRENWLKQSSESYLMANRQMNWFLVSLSFLASATSSLIFVAFTAEFYYFGFTAVWLPLAYYVAAIPIAVVIIPKFYRLGFLLTSAYEYFEHRFNLPVRLFVAAIFTLVQILYLSVVLYTPSLVLTKVSHLNIYWCIFIGGAVCLFYSSFGGMKAVIWVDSIQVFIAIFGVLTLAIKGTYDAGGINKAWETYSKIGERNNWNDINPEPWNRHSVWNIIFMFGTALMGALGTEQSLLQRCLTVPTMKRSQWSVIVAFTIALAYLAMVMIMAIAGFALLGGNEPVLTGRIDSADQIIALILTTVLGKYHGLSGLFVASLYAAALSTLSSGISALSAVFLEDFVKPLYKLTSRGKTLRKKTTGLISRLAGISVGLLILGLAMVIPAIDDIGLIQMVFSFASFYVGPFIGIFFAGFFCYWIESWGAFVGLFLATGWNMMMFFGQRFNSNKLGYDQPPLFLSNFSIAIRFSEPTAEPTLFDVSYTWYAALGSSIFLVGSTIVSLFVHCFRRMKDKSYGKKDFMPSKRLRYTTEDFLVAIGCRKNDVKYVVEEEEEEEEDEDDEKTELPEVSTVNGVMNEKGLDNIGFSDRL